MGRWIAWLFFGRPLEDPTGNAPRRVARRRLLRVHVVAAVSVCVAGATGIVAIVNGRLGVNDLRVLGTSLGFAVFSSISAAGDAARRDRAGLTAWVGISTMTLSAASLCTLVVAIWGLDEGAARASGSLALLTLAASHASIVLRAQRPSDSPAIRLLCAASILLASLDCVTGALLVQGDLEIHDTPAFVKAAAVVFIAMLVTTALPPLLRGGRVRAQSAPATSPPPPPPPPAAMPAPTSEVSRRWLLAPAATCGLAAFTAVAGFVFGQATAKPERRAYATPPYAYAPPPASRPYVAPTRGPNTPPPAPAVLEPGGAVSTAKLIHPAPIFKCPSLGAARPQVVTAPGGDGFERIELRRGSRGLCLRLRGQPVTALWSTYGAAITLELQRPGTHGDPHKYRVTVAGVQDDSGLYIVSLQGPGDREPVFQTRPLTFGQLGVSTREAAVLVLRPRLPRWALDPATRWQIVVE